MTFMIETKVKTFLELSLNELYRILQLRSEVFVVEQDCVYQDIDGKDEKALHVLGIKNKLWLIRAYLNLVIILNMLVLVAWSYLKTNALLNTVMIL